MQDDRAQNQVSMMKCLRDTANNVKAQTHLELLIERSFQALDDYKSKFLTSGDWKVACRALTRALISMW